MRKRRWLGMALLGLGVLGAGAGVTWGTRMTREASGGAESDPGVRVREETALQAPPAPLPDPQPAPRPLTEREQKVASIIETLKKTCVVLKQPGITSFEVAERLGKTYPPYPEGLTTASFIPDNPLLMDDSGDSWKVPEVEAGRTPRAIAWVRMYVRDYGLLTLADLEKSFGPAYLFGDAFLTEVYFRWEPSPEGPFHVRIRAGVLGGDVLDHAHRETDELLPTLHRDEVIITDFHIDRGTLTEEGAFWIGAVDSPPTLIRELADDGALLIRDR